MPELAVRFRFGDLESPAVNLDSNTPVAELLEVAGELLDKKLDKPLCIYKAYISLGANEEIHLQYNLNEFKSLHDEYTQLIVIREESYDYQHELSDEHLDTPIVYISKKYICSTDSFIERATKRTCPLENLDRMKVVGEKLDGSFIRQFDHPSCITCCCYHEGELLLGTSSGKIIAGDTERDLGGEKIVKLVSSSKGLVVFAQTKVYQLKADNTREVLYVEKDSYIVNGTCVEDKLYVCTEKSKVVAVSFFGADLEKSEIFNSIPIQISASPGGLVYVGTTAGEVVCFDRTLSKPRKWIHHKALAEVSKRGPVLVTSMYYDTDDRKLYVGDSSGSIHKIEF